MESARELAARAAAIASPENTNPEWECELEPVVDHLHRHIEAHPEDVDALGPRTTDRYARLKHHAPDLPDTTDGTFRYRNVTLGWVPGDNKWRWPPEDFSEYISVFGKGGPGLHILGECWAMSKITHPNDRGAVVLTGSYAGGAGPRVHWTDASKTVVRCLLGTTYVDVQDFLDLDGTSCLPNQPGFSPLTIAGTIGTGAHGSSLHQGSLASLVRSITLGAIDGSGSETIVRGDPKFDFVVTHLGRLGPVVAIELEVAKRFRIEETRTLHRLGEHGGSWRDELDGLVATVVKTQEDPSVHSCEIWIAPYPDRRGRLTTVVGTRRYTHHPLTVLAKDKRPPAMRWKALQTLARIASILISVVDPRAVKVALRTALKQTLSDAVVMEAREGLDFGAPNDNPMATIESGFEFDGAAPILAVIDELEALAGERRYVFAPLGVRFVGRGERDGLSPQAGRARSMHIEISTFADETHFHGKEILPRLQRRMASLGGRPHWGLNVFLDTDELRALWPVSAWNGLRAIAEEQEGRKRLFANPLLDPILGL